MFFFCCGFFFELAWSAAELMLNAHPRVVPSSRPLLQDQGIERVIAKIWKQLISVFVSQLDCDRRLSGIGLDVFALGDLNLSMDA